MKIKKKIRVGLVGCGRIAHSHLKAITSFDKSFELICVSDVDKKRLNKVSTLYQLKKYSKFQDMIANEQLDLVVICTPNGFHAKQALQVSKYKTDVLIEKPIVLNLKDGENLVNIFKQKRINLFAVMQLRYNETLLILKRALEEKRFGRIHLVQINVFWTRTSKYYSLDQWRGTKKLDGGTFLNQAIHYIDLLNWLFGTVDYVHAITNKYLNIEFEDTGVMNIKWKSGTLGSVSVSVLTYPQNLEASITVMGENGTAKISGKAMNMIEIWNFRNKKNYDTRIKKITNMTTSKLGNRHYDQYLNLEKFYSNKKYRLLTGKEALKSIELVIAAKKSFKMKKIVKISSKKF